MPKKKMRNLSRVRDKGRGKKALTYVPLSIHSREKTQELDRLSEILESSTLFGWLSNKPRKSEAGKETKEHLESRGHERGKVRQKASGSQK